MWVVKKRPNIGVSPSGKASDSDSDISGVRIPAPQPRKKQIAKAICFFQLYSPAASCMHFVRDIAFGSDMRYAR